MTRAVAFVWVALLAATLGVTAQKTAPSAYASQSAPATSSTPSPGSTSASAPATGATSDVQSDTASPPASPEATTPAPASGSEQVAGSNANQNLPKTASFLPLVGLLGLGSLAAGFIMRR